ncbi:hypothetical protein G6F62_015023 [Rhizopus arrhizus]|nr:hypothetical protein G6F62_015023 [Rhizopus arrhizus]
MAQLGRLVGGGAHADPARQHERRQEAQAEHADQAIVVLAALAQATGVTDADGGEVVMDFLAGQAGACIGDAQHAGTGIDLHRDARGRARSAPVRAAPPSGWNTGACPAPSSVH